MPRADEDTVELNIDSSKLTFLIEKAREFDVKVDPGMDDEASNASDDDDRAILEDFSDDSTEAELRDAIEGLNQDEAMDLVALVWIGRGDYDASEWADARKLARDQIKPDLANYLMTIPLLGDFIEEGYAALGHGSIVDEDEDEDEIDR